MGPGRGIEEVEEQGGPEEERIQQDGLGSVEGGGEENGSAVEEEVCDEGGGRVGGEEGEPGLQSGPQHNGGLRFRSACQSYPT
jgi:hypothetical protein